MSSEHKGPHITPYSTYFAVYGALLVLTIATVGVSEWMTLESTVSIIVAMCVAAVKATLVVLFFMHMKWDTKFNQLFFLSGLWFIGVFFIFVLADLGSRGNVLAIEDNFVLRTDLAMAKEAQAKAEEEAKKTGAPAPAFDAVAAFTNNCSTCHGTAGDGKGPAGAALTPPPANFTDPAFWASRTDEGVAKVIKPVVGGVAEVLGDFAAKLSGADPESVKAVFKDPSIVKKFSQRDRKTHV